MAKRSRYPNRTRPARKRAARPAGSTQPAPTAPSQRVEPIPVDLPDDQPMRASSADLTDAEIRRAEELEAEATARERAAIVASLRRRNRPEEAAARPAADHNAPLSVRMAHEYAYVARDVRRIVLTASLMIAILAVLYILSNVLGVISL